MWGFFFPARRQLSANSSSTCKSGDHSKAKKLNRLNTSNLRGILQPLKSAHLFPSAFWSVWQLCPCTWQNWVWAGFSAVLTGTAPCLITLVKQLRLLLCSLSSMLEGAHDLLLLLLYQKGIQQQCFPPDPQSPRHSCRNCLEHRWSKEWPIRFGQNRKAAVGSRPVPLL